MRPDGTGRYDAILLTNSSLLYADGGGYVSGFDGTEWNTLWAYERDYSVRQAVLYGSYGTFPENYCLTGSSEGGVGDTALNTKLTTAGRADLRLPEADRADPARAVVRLPHRCHRRAARRRRS